MNWSVGSPDPKGCIPVCPYCQAEAQLVTGKEIYPHRSDLYGKMFWQCAPCGAYVGCHRAHSEGGTGDGTAPLGRLANAELRQAKMAAHAAFDPLWKPPTGKMNRRAAYRALSRFMGLEQWATHIGMFDVEQCRLVVRFVQETQHG